MTRMRTSLIVWACLAAAMLFSGCSQKKVAAAPPQPPPAAAVPSPTPEAGASAAQTQTQQSQTLPGQGTPPPEPQQPTETQPSRPAPEKSESAKAKPAKQHGNGKKAGAEAARNSKQVVKADGDQPVANAGQISPTLSHAEIAHDQATIEQLLQSTEATLNGIKRDLSPEEQAKVAQVHDYVNQSRQATKANDLTRAYNLAMKARLLSDDVAKPR